MKRQGRNLTNGTQGDDVRLLHRELRLLGFRIPASETRQGVFGPKTEAAVRKLQEKARLKVTGVVNRATARAIDEQIGKLPAKAGSKAMTQSPAAPPPAKAADEQSDSFKVTGTVTSPDRDVIGVLRVEIVRKQAGPDVPLAETTTDARGRYAVDFPASKLPAEMPKPDLQARISAGTIFLAASEIKYEATSPAGLDVTVPANTQGLPSEYESLVAAIGEHYKGKLRDLEESGERKDITYLAEKCGCEARSVAMAAAADELAAETPIHPAFYYALLRDRVPAEPEALYQTDLERVSGIWRTAIDQGVIPQSLDGKLAEAEKEFQKLAVKHTLDSRPVEGTSSLGELVELTLSDKNQQEKFAGLYARHRNDPTKLWDEVRSAFGGETAERLRLDSQLASLTLNNAPLIKALRGKVSTPEDLVSGGFYNAEAWKNLVAKSPIPSRVPGSSEQERRANYAEVLAEQVRQALPTAVIAEKIRKNEIKLPPKAAKKAAPAASRAAAAPQDAAQSVAPAMDTVLTAEQLSKARVDRITQDVQASTVLLSKGLDSAYDIVAYEEEEFVRLFKDPIGGEAKARQIYAQAKRVHNTVLNVAVSYMLARTAPGLGMTPDSSVLLPASKPPEGSVGAYPTLETLFGSMDYCACEHCRSVLSPAAYLVDLLQFVDRPEEKEKNPQQVLLGRRPDLQHLPLTCENTNTPVPYIDLVNETLEYFVTHSLSLANYKGYDTGGNVSPEELLANPQFVNEAAYNTLKTEIFPPPLPFHKPLETLRRHFDQNGVPLHQAMEALRKDDAVERPDAAGYGWRDILMERLELSRDEYRLLTDRTLTVQQLYGLPDAADPLVELVKAKPFTRRVGITYEELAEILGTRFLRRVGPVVLIDTSGSPVLFSFDAVEFRLAKPDGSKGPLLKIHYVALLRFIRLWKKLGLSIAQTDQLIAVFYPAALQQPGGSEAVDLERLDAGFLALMPRSGAAFQVLERLELTPERGLPDLLACWSPPAPGGTNASRAWLAGKLRLSVAELQSLILFTGLDPFALPDPPQLPMLRFLNLLESLAAADLKPAQALYLVWNEDLSGKSVPDDRLITELARSLRANFAAVENELASSNDPDGKMIRKRQQAIAIASAALRTEPDFTQALLTDKNVLHSAADAAKPALDDLLALESTAAGGIVIRGSLSGYLEPPRNGFYKLRIEAQADAPLMQLRIDGTAVELERSGNVWTNKRPIELTAGALHGIDLSEVSSATLHWQTEGLDWQAVPARRFYFVVLVTQLRHTVIRLLKTSSLASSLKMTAREIVHFATRTEYQVRGEGWLNSLFFSGRLGEPNWKALGDVLTALLSFARLKAELSPDDERLLSALQKPDTLLADGRSLLLSLTGWETASRDAFLARFGLAVAGLARVESFSRVHAACRMAKKVGIPAAALLAAVTNEPAASTVQALQAALRARHDESGWRAIIRPINDELRGLQRDALVAFILRRIGESATTRHIDTADKLFEYFLMDVEMEPCMQTTRVRHALSAAQLFIERCLMNLETGVAPSLISSRQWEWMKRYRLWEANRKVFLWPENWLEPELRDDQSPFFKESMSELLQGDVTDDAAATALLGYLSKLNEIAKLEPCDIYYQEGQPGKGNGVAHVIARTTGANRKYYYRRREAGSWTPWEHIKLDVEGNPVRLVIWQGRLFLFWVKVLTKGPQNPQMPRAGQLSTVNTWDVPSNPLMRAEIVLCWSEYFGGKWQPARTSDPERPSLVWPSLSSFDRTWLGFDGLLDGEGLRLMTSWYRNGFRLYNTHSLPVRLEDLPIEHSNYPTRTGTVRYVGYYYPGSLYAYVVNYDPLSYSTDYREILKSKSLLQFPQLVDSASGLFPRYHLKSPGLAPFLFGDGHHLFYVTTMEKPATIVMPSSFGASAQTSMAALPAPAVAAGPLRQQLSAPPSAGSGSSRFARFLSEEAGFRPNTISRRQPPQR